ncbi:PilZ domain-containing protein [bacterium]|nr:PilZ domain-containing protein [bacterium]
MNTAHKKTNEARKHPRHALTGKVLIHNEDHLYIAPLNNIGRGGVFVDRLVSLVVGEKVKLVIKSAHLVVPIQATGTVIRVETEDRIGSAVQFDWVEPTGLAQL